MRKILSILSALLLCTTMWTTADAATQRVYCKVTQGWWTDANAAVAVHYWGGSAAGTTWPGTRTSSVEGEEGLWSYDVPSDVDGFMFTRVSGSGNVDDWNAKTADLTLPTDGKDVYTINNTSGCWADASCTCTGSWSKYFAPVSGYAGTYTSDITLTTTGGTSASTAKVVISGTQYDAIKAGTTKVAGAVVLTVPANVQKLHFHALGWKGETVKLSFTGITADQVALTADAGVSNNSPFAILENPATKGYFTVDVNTTEETQITLTASAGKRFVVFGVNKEAAPVPVDSTTIYFYNKLDWNPVKAFVWLEGTGIYKDWSGEAMTKTADQVDGKYIYSYTFPSSFTSVIFNNGTDQTTDLAWSKKTYFVPNAEKNDQGKYDGTWYASKEEIPVPCKDGPYGFILNEKDTVPAVLFNELDPVGRKQYKIDSLELKAGDKFILANLSCNDKWVMKVEEGGASADFTADSAFYIKMSLEQGDVMYIAEIKDEPVVPTCQDGPYGFILNEKDTVPAVLFNELDPVGRKQYKIDSLELKAGDKFILANLSCNDKWVMKVEEGGASADFTADSGRHVCILYQDES